MDAERLPGFEQALFGHARPNAIVITTPNRDYNALFPALPAGRMRHPDHRFEWSRDEFRHWSQSVALTHGYQVRFEGIGVEDAACGAPTQMDEERLRCDYRSPVALTFNPRQFGTGNILLIPGTSSVVHLRENLAAAALELPDESMTLLNGA